MVRGGEEVGNELIEHSFHKYTRFDFFFTGKTGVVILFITPVWCIIKTQLMFGAKWIVL